MKHTKKQAAPDARRRNRKVRERSEDMALVPLTGEEPAVTGVGDESDGLGEDTPFRSKNPFSDDALGLYLKQMGAIPRLNRDEELDLARRLETARRRYRRAVLCHWWVIARVVESFEHLHAGHGNLEQSVEAVSSLGLTTERIRSRLPGHLRKLRRLLAEVRAESPPPLPGASGPFGGGRTGPGCSRPFPSSRNWPRGPNC